VHDIQEHVTHIVTEAGVRADSTTLRELVALTTQLAEENCLSVLPPDGPHPEHVAHLTSLHVIATETRLRDLFAGRATQSRHRQPDLSHVARRHRLDPAQARAAAAVASADPLVIVEGGAGAGKTSMLAAAIEGAAMRGRATRVITPTKKAADVAHHELGVAAESVAKLVHEHGWRWNRDSVWTRLVVGDRDPDTDAAYAGPAASARLTRGERIVVDEAGMLDQDTALALLTLADEHGATVALVGDRAQLAAIGRGGVLEMAAQLLPRVHRMTAVHRFIDPEYAALTVQMRRGEHPEALFNRLRALGLVAIYENPDALLEALAREWRDGCAMTVATNHEARELNARIREERVSACRVDDSCTATGSDGLSIGCGDVIQTRRNDSAVRVANRQTWVVQSVREYGAVWAKERAAGRRQRTVWLPAEYVATHTHLAYASTAFGMQGATTAESHTVVGDAMAAASVYMGMTRGRNANHLHFVASDVDDARQQFVLAMKRDRADRGLVNATASARESVRGLTTGVEKGRRTIPLTDRTRFSRGTTPRRPPDAGLRR
jgi:ATP-dependent exoDNAse (exonuclease V) alpha subunit